MTQHDPLVTLRQMIDFARGLAEIARGRSRPDLDTNQEFHWAVLRGLEVLGEAARRLPDDFRDRYPAIPWRQIIGMRNQLIHGYENVDMEAVWRALHERVLTLSDDLVRILGELEGSGRR